MTAIACRHHTSFLGKAQVVRQIVREPGVEISTKIRHYPSKLRKLKEMSGN